MFDESLGMKLFMPILAMMTTAAFAVDDKCVDWDDPLYSLVLNATNINSYPIVVFGEFILAEETDINPFEPRVISTIFRIDESIKGPERQDSISVITHSDRLAYPGETISIYEKRFQLLNEIFANRERLEKQMDDLRVARAEQEIGDEEFQTRISEIKTDLARLRSDSIAIPFPEVHIYTSHSNDIYDRGGSIMQKKKYILGFDRQNDTEYVLRNSKEYDLRKYTGISTIFWGDESVLLAELVRKMQDKTYPHRDVCAGMIH